MYRRYYSYNDMPVPIKTKPPEKKQTAVQKKEPKPVPTDFLGKLEADDLVLLAVIFLLLIDDCNDILLLLALGFIFISKE